MPLHDPRAYAGGGGDPPDAARLRRNVARMREQGAGEREVREYLQSEGVSDPRSFLDPGHARGAKFSFLSEATAGFSDEILGAAAATLSPVFDRDNREVRGEDWRDRYEHYRDRARTTQRDYEAAHPFVSGAARVAGAVTTAAGIGAAARLNSARNVSRATRFRRAVGEGVGLGAVSGAGHSESETLGGRLRDAGVGAVAGAVTGGVVDGVGRLVAPLTRSARTRAGHAVFDAIEESGEDASEVLNRTARSEIGEVLADQSEPLRKLAHRVQRVPSEAGKRQQKALEQRVATRLARREALKRQRRATAREMFGRVPDAPVDHPLMNRLLERPEIRRMYENIVLHSEARGTPIPRLEQAGPTLNGVRKLLSDLRKQAASAAERSEIRDAIGARELAIVRTIEDDLRRAFPELDAAKARYAADSELIDDMLPPRRLDVDEKRIQPTLGGYAGMRETERRLMNDPRVYGTGGGRSVPMGDIALGWMHGGPGGALSAAWSRRDMFGRRTAETAQRWLTGPYGRGKPELEDAARGIREYLDEEFQHQTLRRGASSLAGALQEAVRQ